MFQNMRFTLIGWPFAFLNAILDEDLWESGVAPISSLCTATLLFLALPENSPECAKKLGTRPCSVNRLVK